MDILEFFTNISNIAIVGSIVSIIISILTWYFSPRTRINENIEANQIITKVLDLSLLALKGEKNIDLRASIMLLDKNEKDLKIVYVSSNMVDAPDSNLRFEKWQGAAGRALGYKTSVLVDLTIPEVEGMASMGLTAEQKALTKNIVTVYSSPIRDPNNMEKVIGVLNIDSSKNLVNYFREDEVRSVIDYVTTQLAITLKSAGVV